MKRCYLLILLGWLPPAAHGQKALRDSLEQQLARHPAADTFRIRLLNELTYCDAMEDPATGLERAAEARTLAARLADSAGLATSYNYTALNYAALGSDTTALLWFEKSLKISRELGRETAAAAVLHNLGISLINLGRYEQAFRYQEEAYDIYKKRGHEPGQAATLNSMGVVMLLVADYPRSLDYDLKALRLFEGRGDSLNMGVAFTNIGLVYSHLGDTARSLDYQLKAMHIFQRLGSSYNLQNTYTNLGNRYEQLGKKAEALDYYHRALAINLKTGNNRGLASGYQNIGILYINAGDYPAAAEAMKKSVDLYQQLDDPYGLAIAYCYLATLYTEAPAGLLRQLGIPSGARYTRALRLLKKSQRLAAASGDLSTEGEAWGAMSKAYAHTGHYSQALEAYKKYALLKDSIAGEEKKVAATRLTMQYAFDKKTLAIEAQHAHEASLAAAALTRQQTIKKDLGLGAGLLLIAGATSFLFHKRRKDAETHRKEAEHRAETTETEMKALRAQMNPHFIFNSLNSIADYINRHDIPTADRYLAKFAKMMRLILEHSEQREIPLEADLHALELYMQLESLRMNGKFTYEIQVDENIDTRTTMVPPLILQPFVENSIWHGIAQKKGPGKIRIEIRREAEMVNCLVEDNGVGRKPGRSTVSEGGSKSLGMKITQARIDLLNKADKPQADIALSDLTEGTRVEVRFPLAFK